MTGGQWDLHSCFYIISCFTRSEKKKDSSFFRLFGYGQVAKRIAHNQITGMAQMECRCRDAQDKYVMQMHDAHSELFG